MHGGVWGACVAVGHVWWGTCMAGGGMCGGRGMCGKGACVVGACMAFMPPPLTDTTRYGQ